MPRAGYVALLCGLIALIGWGVANAAPKAGSVPRSTFTTGIEEREPLDSLYTLSTDLDYVYFFTELQDLSGQTVVHRWEYDGEVRARVAFDVAGPRWRVWSRKTLRPEWTGTWTVSVLNAAGDVIHRATLQYMD